MVIATFEGGPGMNEDLNPYGVRVGQVWQSCDKRDPYRRVTVERVEGEYAWVRWVRLSKIRLTNFRPHSTGYKLWRDVEGCGDE